MATTKQHLPSTGAPRIENTRVAIVTAEWNAHINEMMTSRAVETFKAHGVNASDIDVFRVPGAIELTFAAAQAIDTDLFEAVIVFGTVIRGGTPHFDYVCQSVTQGITTLNSDYDVPVIFGVLTVDREEDAVARADGSVGDKGAECAEAALKMIALSRHLKDL